MNDWLTRQLLAGNRVIVPAIVYYEIRRELLRSRRTAGLERLDAFAFATPDRYLRLSDDALRLAAELWATSRQGGHVTADRTALDVDVILAAQVLSSGSMTTRAVVATTNPKHLSFFLSARLWNEIDTH